MFAFLGGGLQGPARSRAGVSVSGMRFVDQGELCQAPDSTTAEHRRRILERLPGAEERFWEPVLARLREPGAHS